MPYLLIMKTINYIDLISKLVVQKSVGSECDEEKEELPSRMSMISSRQQNRKLRWRKLLISSHRCH